MGKLVKTRLDNLRYLTRNIEADENEARFEETVRKIAPRDRKTQDDVK